MKKLRLRLLTLSLFATVLAANPVFAQSKPVVTPDLAYGAFQRGFYLTALREAEARLKKQPKDAAAMTLLGELYSQGLGVVPQPEIAAGWYEKAARLGDAHAMTTLGLMMIEGAGVTRNPIQGKALLEQAAGKGDVLASYNLALLLLSTGAPIDAAHATMLIRRAAEADIPDAQHALGVLYMKGRGVEKNMAEAAQWFLRAAENGSTNGEVEYAILAFNGEGMPANPELAAKFFRRAAYKGNAIAQNRLARLYAVGKGVPKNKVEAASWHMAAAAQGLSDAWLDADLREITADERARAERLMTDRLPPQ